MTIKVQQTTVDDTATPLHTVDTGFSGTRLLIKNNGVKVVALGPLDVTFETGFHLEKGEQINLPLAQGDLMCGICAIGTTTVVHILKALE